MLFSYGITLLILCPLIFLAAFIDSIAGGGGLISLPSYLLVGIPIHTAGGTNKFSGSVGTLIATANYIRGGCIDFRSAITGSIGAFLGAWVGTKLALSLSPRVLQISLMVILPVVGVFVIFRKERKNTEPRPALGIRLKLLLCFLIGLVFGCYDGFFGPGTGMFITIVLSTMVRFELIKAVGTAKVINFSSNFISMVTWLVNGKILFPIAIPCAVCSLLGGYLGSRLAMKIGKKIIRPILVLVAILLFAKILFDLIFKAA